MKIQERIKDNLDENIGWKLKRSFGYGLVMGIYGERLLALETQFENDGFEIEVDQEVINITAKSRSGLLAAIQLFGGKWIKEIATWEPGLIIYRQTIEHPLGYQFYVSCKGSPPPSCVIEEYEELVPAQVVKRKRIVCPNTTPEAAPDDVQVAAVVNEDGDTVNTANVDAAAGVTSTNEEPL